MDSLLKFRHPHGLVQEINEFYSAAEQHSLLELYTENYGIREMESIKKIEKSANNQPNFLKKSWTNLQATNAIKKTIREMIENKNNLIFDDSWTKSKNPIKIQDLRKLICQQIDHFLMSIEKKTYETQAFYNERKKKFVDTTLSQELTNAAYFSIRKFMEILKNSKGVISIDCLLPFNHLVLPIKAVFDELKYVINELTRNERIKITPEETEDILDQLQTVLDGLLRVDELQKLPHLSYFYKLIRNEELYINASEDEIIKTLKESRHAIMKLEFCPEVVVFSYKI